MELVELIKKYRAEHGLSQRQFAEECGLSNGYISLLEKGLNRKTNRPVTPTLPTLQLLANGMHITLTELLSSVDDMPIDLSEGFGDIGDINEPPASPEESGWSDLDLDIARLILSLSPEKKQDAIKYLRYLADSASD